MTLKWCIGVFSFSLSVLAILLNLTIFMPVLRLAFVSRKSTIYVIAFFNIISDLCQLIVTCFLSASIVADRYVFSEERLSSRSVFLGGVFMVAWYMECLVQVVMAVNRFTVITLKRKNIFTFNTTMIIFVFLVMTTLVSGVSNQWIFPCCQFIGDHQVMSYMFVAIEGEYSYSNLMLVVYDVLCTLTSTLCYVFVFLTVRTSHKKQPKNVRNTRSNQDFKYLLQFVFISIFYIFTWVLFELLPYIVPADKPEWFAVVPVFITLNCTSNSVIYLSVNRDVQKSLQIPWLRKKLAGPKNSTVINVLPATAT